MNNEPDDKSAKRNPRTAETVEVERDIDRDPVVVRRRNPLILLLRGILYLVRIPERILGLIYRHSPIRTLLYKMEWYRDLADQSEIETILADTYGGAATFLLRLRHFIRKNILFSVIIVAGLYVAGTHSVPKVLNLPSVRTALGKPLIDSESRIKEIAKTREESKRVRLRRTNIESFLEHCAIKDKTRTTLLSALDDSANFTKADYASSMAVIRRYVSFLNDYDLEAETEKTRQHKRTIEQSLTLPIERVMADVSALKARERGLQNALSRLRTEFEHGGGHAAVGTVNRSIKLRDEYEEQLASYEIGPTERDLSALDERVTRIRQQLEGVEKAPIVARLDRVEPKWMGKIVSTNKDEQSEGFTELMDTRLSPILDKLTHRSRAAITKAVLDLTALSEELSIALARVNQLSDGVGEKFLQRELTANQQIGRFLGQENAVWISHRECENPPIAIE